MWKTLQDLCSMWCDVREICQLRHVRHASGLAMWFDGWSYCTVYTLMSEINITKTPAHWGTVLYDLYTRGQQFDSMLLRMNY